MNERTSKRRAWLLCPVLLMTFIVSGVLAQESGPSIDDLIDSPSTYINRRVTVTGIVTQFIRGTGEDTDHYLLRGPFGSIIRVNTGSGQPELNQRYEVSGIVYEDSTRRSIFISEQSRSRTGGLFGLLGRTGSPIVIVIVVALIIAVLFYILKSRKSVPSVEPASAPVPPPRAPATPASPAQDTQVAHQELATVRISTAPKTVRFIPGVLEILSGADRGKTFRITGYPTEKGEVVTVGRQRVAGERAHAHIQLGDVYPTVSRRQAEFRARDGKLYLKNESETNPTQVNGRPLGVGEEVEITFDTLINMGELELKYRK